MHPSNEYVVILTDQGFYYIFNLAEGDIRGKQKVDKKSRDLKLDPSGLYMSLVVGTKIQIFELAKGTMISEIDPEFNGGVSCHQFSGTGQEYIVVSGSHQNVVLRFFELDKKISKVINKV